MMNPVKSLALCAILLYPPLSTGQLSGVVPGTTTNIPDSTTATSGSDTGSTAEHVTDTPDEIAAPSTDISVTPPRTVGTAAPTAPAEPAAVPPADAEAPAAAFAAPVEDTGTPAETPDTVSEPAGATPESAAESDVAPADPSVEAPTDSPESNETAAAAPVAPRDFNRVKSHMVIVRDEIDEDARQAPGFGLSDQGHILTDSSALRSQDTYLVSVAGGPVFTASALKTDEETGLMLLRIVEQGHGLTALTFARTSLAAAAQLHAVKFTPGETEPFTFVAGTVTQLPTDADESPLIVHNALFNVAAAGTPLLNRCWEVVGINVLQRKGFQQKRIDPMEQSSARSLPASWLSAFLASANLSLPMAESECLSLEEETRLRMEKFQQEKEAALQAQQAEAEARARAVTEEAQRKEEELNRETAAVQQQLEQTRQDNEQALQAEREAAEAERARLEVEAQQRLEQAQQAKEQAVQAQQQEAELARQATHRGKQVLSYSLVVILVLVLVFLLVMRARRKRLQGVEQEKQQVAQSLDKAQADLSDVSEREQLRTSAPDVLVEGITPQGERIVLKIPGVSLVEKAGAVIGRSPSESAFIINHEQVSRRHFRLLLVSGQVMIEDLGSTNGTSVNGIPLNPGARQPLGDGSRLQTGNLALTVRIGP